MPKNNSKARRDWRKLRADMATEELTPEERLLRAIFGNLKGSDDKRPGTEFGDQR